METIMVIKHVDKYFHPREHGGDTAVKTGRKHEDAIQRILKDAQREYPEFNITFRKIPKNYSKKLGMKQCINIYGLPAVPDIIVKGMPGYENGMYIESKKQTVSGTGDEKFLFAIANSRLYDLPTLFIITLVARTGTSAGVQKRFDAIRDNFFINVVKNMHGGKCPICNCDDEKSMNLINIISESQFENWISDQVMAHKLNKVVKNE
jgi:hypothetical protein